jgi:pimeloyl-ACP methyl ester carboxylesterase
MKRRIAPPAWSRLALDSSQLTTAVACLLSACAFLAARPAAAETAEPQSFDSKGCSIRYAVEGKGEPVVLIHGLDSSADINWRLPGTIKMLAESYQVISFDLRGHDHSGKPENESDYGLEMMEDVVRLLDHLKIEKAHIVGYSLGGMIAVKLVVAHPQRVKSVVLGGSGWLKEGSGLQAVWGMIPDRKASGGNSVNSGKGPPAACMHSIGKLAVTKEEFLAIHVPMTILVGDRDPMKRLYVDAAQAARPDLPVVVIEGAGHLNCIFKPQFKEELKKALDRQAKKQ